MSPPGSWETPVSGISTVAIAAGTLYVIRGAGAKRPGEHLSVPRHPRSGSGGSADEPPEGLDSFKCFP